MIKLFSKLNPVAKPENVFWWLEFICNLKCNHCDIGKKTKMHQFTPNLSLEEKKLVIDKISAWLGKPYNLTFLAGEPLLHKDIWAIIEYANQKKAQTAITSNGTLIGPKQAKDIVSSKLNSLALSLDSYIAKIHDESRGAKGVRDKVMAAVDFILTEKKKQNSNYPKISINTIIMRDNLKEIPKLIDWVKKKKLSGISFQPIASPTLFEVDGPFNDSWYENSSLWPDKKEALQLIDNIKSLKEKNYPILTSNNDLKRFRNYFSDPIKFSKTESTAHELKNILVDYSGNIKLCPSIEKNLGNIFNKNLNQMWNSRAANKSRKHILECVSQCKILANNS